jgi:anti-anti-sigma factor
MSQGFHAVPGLDESCLAVRSDRVNGHHEVRLTGELDLAGIGLVDREMQAAERSDAAKIVLNLDELEFVDASGLRLLLDLEARSQADGKRLRIRRANSAQVRRMLDVTGVGDRLPLVD